MPVWAISWKVQKELKLNLVHTCLLMRGSAEDKYHTPILHFTWVIFPYFFPIKCGSLNSVMYWCTNGVWLQVLPFIDKRHGEHSLLPAILLVFKYYHYHNYYHYHHFSYSYYHYYYVKTIHAISIYFSTGIIRLVFFLVSKEKQV